MNKILVALLVAAVMASVSAIAKAEEAQGVLKSIDAAKKTVTLQDDSVYVLPASVDPASLKVGEAITITFEQEGEKKMASKIIK